MDNVTVRQDGLITREMAAQLCGVATDTISQWIRRSHLGVARREGRTVLLNLVEVAKADHLLRKRASRSDVPMPSWALDGEPDIDLRPFLDACAAAGRKETGLREGVVYYILFGDRIKIGTSISLRSRLDSLPCDEVLATEPGGFDVERKRHAQFDDCRIRGEWFKPTRQLLAHIAALASLVSDV